MKHIESYSLNIDMREDFLACYREVAPGCITQYGAYRKAANHPAKRYYITPKQAMQVISKYLKGDHDVVDKMKPNRRRLYHSLINEVLDIANKPEHQGKQLIQICRIAVLRPAPSFFISPGYAKMLFVRTRKGYYNEDGKYDPTLKQKNKRNRYGSKYTPARPHL